MASVDRIGRAALGASWVLARGTAHGFLQGMAEEQVVQLVRVIAEEADRLRGRLS